MNIEQFIKEINLLGIDITEKQLVQLEKYYELLVEWNEKINLTSILVKEDVYLKHFYDSLTVTKVVDFNNVNSICDVGTGAGFPGLVLKIIFPKINVVLVDAIKKKLSFLDEVIKQMELTGIKTVHARAEDFGINNREQFDIVVARAVAPLKTLLEYCIPIVKVGGNFIAMKANISGEIINSENALKKLDCNIEKIELLYLPIEKSVRNIVKITKRKATNKTYPRKPNIVKNNPL